MGHAPVAMLENLAASNRHDPDATVSSFAEGRAFDMSRGGERMRTRHVGMGHVRTALAGRFACNPDVRHGEDRRLLIADAPRTASERQPTGTTDVSVRVGVMGCNLWALRDGRIARKTFSWERVER